jgi:hypothetical protein
MRIEDEDEDEAQRRPPIGLYPSPRHRRLWSIANGRTYKNSECVRAGLVPTASGLGCLPE